MYRETFGANVDAAYGRGVTDMTSRLQSGMAALSAGGNALGGFIKQSRDAQRGIKDLSAEISRLDSEFAFANSVAQFRSLNRQIDQAEKNIKKLKQQARQGTLDAFERGLGRVTKSLIGMNASILTIGFDFLISSIKRVYELQERWTKAIGGFNLRIGGMTAGLKGAQQAATQWSGVIRGLTDGDIGEGIQMFADFTDAIGRTVEKGDQFQRFGIQLARGFNLGGQGAGQLTKVLENIGNTSGSASETVKDMVKAANAAGVPTNLLAKDVLDASVYMARFGKEGQKTFVQGAAYARKFTISMEQLKNSVEGLDMFDQAAQTSSKLNAVFGTMINSMDLMLEDDPAKRLEMIRQQFLRQGTTFDKLTPKQRRYLGETLKLTEDQVGALLKAENAGQSYADFQEKAAKKERNELNAKQMMEKQLRATAQTMYAFGVAFDQVTVAIGHAIKPLLEVLGLADDGKKHFDSFGRQMGKVTYTVVEFFESLLKNEKWKSFMRELANDLKRAASALGEFVMSGRAADLVGDIARGMKSFYVTVRDLAIKAVPALRPLLDAFLFLSKHLKEIAILWAGLKGFNMAGGVGGMGGKAMGGIGRAIGGGSLLKGAGRVGIAGAAGLAGNAIGGTGAGIGAGIGAMAGKLIPIPVLGPIIGSLVGGLIGKGIQSLLSSGKPEKTNLENAQEDLIGAIRREETVRRGYELTVDAATARQKAEAVIRQSRGVILQELERSAITSKTKDVVLSKEQAKLLSTQAHELTMFSKSTSVSQQMLESLGEGSRLTAKQLIALHKGANEYEGSLSKLRDTSEQILKQQQAQLDVSGIGIKKTTLQLVTKNIAADLAANKAKQSDIGEFKGLPGISTDISSADKQVEDLIELKERSERDFSKVRAKLTKREQEQLDIAMKIRQGELENTKNEKKLQLLQTDFIKQQSIIQLRAIEMSSGRFLEFSKAHPEIKSTVDAFNTYLTENSADLKALYGNAGYDLIRNVPKFAEGGVVTRPTVAMIGEAGPEAVVPLSRMNYAAAGNSGGGTQVVTQMADIHLDGQKVGRAIVRTAITGRN